MVLDILILFDKHLTILHGTAFTKYCDLKNDPFIKAIDNKLYDNPIIHRWREFYASL